MAGTLPSSSGRAWADPSAGGIGALILESRRIGWRPALEHIRSSQPFFVKRMEDLALANWHVLACDGPRRRSLDVGSGFGSMVLGLGESFDSAIGVEMLPERVGFASLRAKQDGRPCHFLRSSGLELPFDSRTFDLVTMNGVLEWAGLYADGTPEANQQRMLGEARRVLAPGGRVAVAIENRYALESLLGLRDTHTGLPWITALPRPLADLVSRIRRREPYRTYLYSLRGYERLFRRAGFPHVRVLDLVSSYNDYDFVVDPNDGDSYAFLMHHGLVRPFLGLAGSVRRIFGAIAPGLLGHLGYAYLVLAGRNISTLLDTNTTIWQAIGALPGLPGRRRFAVKGEQPGELAVVAHDGARVTGIVELSAARTGLKRRASILPDRLVGTLASGLMPVAEGEQPGFAWRAQVPA